MATLTGTSGNDYLQGGAEMDFLDGGAGADTLIGGLGDDFYIIDNAGDVVIENAGEGYDVVLGSISHALADNVESLLLTGDGAIDGTGNASDNWITGNGANNRLEGAEGNDLLEGARGNDMLAGGAGSDFYVFGVGDGEDVVFENDTTPGNFDIVNFTQHVSSTDVMMYRDASSLYLSIKGTGDVISLRDWFVNPDAHVEQVLFYGDWVVWDQAILANAPLAVFASANGGELQGSAKNDLLIGQSGVDVMLGRGGDDTLQGGAGSDTLDGGAGDDLLSGGEGNDILTGGKGDDTLGGGAGSDVMDGGSGNDTYLVFRGIGQDTIIDTDRRSGNTDVLQFANNINHEQLWFRHVGDDLEISVIGSTDSVTIQDWYAGSGHQIEEIWSGDKHLLTSGEVDILVSAMADLPVPPPGVDSLSADYFYALYNATLLAWY